MDTNGEITFNRAKKLRKLAQACEDGFLLYHEITDSTLRAVNVLRAQEAKNEAKRANEAKRLREVLRPAQKVVLCGKPVFIEVNVPDYDGAQAACRAQTMRLQADRSDAIIFVLADPSKLGQRTSWALAVHGLASYRALNSERNETRLLSVGCSMMVQAVNTHTMRC